MTNCSYLNLGIFRLKKAVPTAPIWILETMKRKTEINGKSNSAGGGGNVKRSNWARLNHDDKERAIVKAAICFFADVGFDGSLRDLAKRLDMTHQNLFRYFPTKEVLIERVYKDVYLDHWRPEWEILLTDPKFSFQARLIAFYQAYLTAIYRYDWVRIFVYAGLKDVGITQRYMTLIQRKVIEPIGYDLRRVARLPVEPERRLGPLELEAAWSLHGELFYVAVRRWVYNMAPQTELKAIVELAVSRFLAGAPTSLSPAKNT